MQARSRPGRRNDALRVLIVSQPTSDGVAVCVRHHVQAAVTAGYDVTVACPAAGQLSAWAMRSGAAWQRLELRRTPQLADMLAVLQIRRLARSSHVVHLHSSKAGGVGRLALASMGKHRPSSVFTPHGWSWLAGGWLAPAYQVLERVLLPVTTAVVAVSDEERAAGVAVLGRRAVRIEVIPNGVDTARFCPRGQAAARPDGPLIVCVGRLSRQRGPDVAVAAMAMMRTSAAQLRLVGEGIDRRSLECQVRALRLTARVELAGRCDDPAPELRAADVVVVPSRYDGMALVLLEAMACGAAIVATRVAGSSVLAGAGVLVGADDPRALADAVDELLADPERRHRLGIAARQRVIERYSLERSVDETIRLWRRIGACPSAGRPAQARRCRNAQAEEKAI